jgi:hypothetical protein
MNEEVKKRLKGMPREQQQRRYRELREKLGITNPRSIAGGRAPLESELEDHEEYQCLAELLGYKSGST